MNTKNILLTGLILTGLLASARAISDNKKNTTNTHALNDCVVYVGINDKTAYVSTDDREIVFYCGQYDAFDLSNSYDASIFGLCFYGQYVDDIETIHFLTEVRCDDCTNLFKDLVNLSEIVNLDYLDTSNASSMKSMFEGCLSLTNIDLSDLNTESVFDMSSMFKNCTFTTIDLQSFNVKNVSDVSEMFCECSNLETINFPDFSSPSLFFMDRMLNDCESLKEVDFSTFNLKNLRSSDFALRGTEPYIIKSPSVLPSGGAPIDFYLQQFSERERFYFDSDFTHYTKISPNDGGCDANKTLYLDSLFYLAFDIADYFNIDSQFYIKDGKITDVGRMVYSWGYVNKQFKEEFENDYKDVAFNILKNADSNIPDEEIKTFITAYDMIYNTYSSILTDVGGDYLERCPNAGKPDGLIHLGYDEENNIGYISNNNSKEILTSDYYWTCLPFETRSGSIFSTFPGGIDVSELNKVVIQNEITLETANGFFKDLENLVEIEGIMNLDVSNVTNFESMFENCASLETIDLSALAFDDAELLSNMFKDCTSLRILDISSITTNPSSMMSMFENCVNLFEVDLSQFDFKVVSNYLDIFKNASALAVKTPKNVQNDIDLPLGTIPGTNKFYDLDFNEYTILPKNSSSMLLVGEAVKHKLVNFCENFIDECDLICDYDGNSDINKIIRLWSNTQEDAMDHFVNGSMPWIMEFLKQDNSSHKCLELKEFCEKYDYIYSKYHSTLEDNGGDFLSRSSLITFKNNNSINLILANMSENNITIIVVVSLFTFVGFSIFLLKKKYR